MEEAIALCQNTLVNFDSRESAIVVISDGNPTARVGTDERCDGDSPGEKCKDAAAAEANATKADGIDIATVFIETVYDPIPDKAFLETKIASPTLGFTPPTFPTAVQLAKALAQRVQCSSD